jgi:curved DNA-binding protein CbpA
MGANRDSLNCYQILGVAYTATQDEIYAACERISKRLQMRQHGAETDPTYLSQLEHAAQILLNPQLRKEYDQGIVGDPKEFLKLYEKTQEFSVMTNLERESIEQASAPIMKLVKDSAPDGEPQNTSARVRKGTLTGAIGTGAPGAAVTVKPKKAGSPSPYPGSSPGQRPRRPSIDASAQTVAALNGTDDDDKYSPAEIIILFFIIALPLITGIWAALMFLSD